MNNPTLVATGSGSPARSATSAQRHISVAPQLPEFNFTEDGLISMLRDASLSRSSLPPTDLNTSSTIVSSPPPITFSPIRRRPSIEEDLLYQQIINSSARRPSAPPPYQEANTKIQTRQRSARQVIANKTEHSPKALPTPVLPNVAADVLPPYSCSVNCEGVFSRKMEIEQATKRATYRNWQSVYVMLQGTALNIYGVSEKRGFGRSRGGPDVSPDRPPWVRPSELQKAYSLQYADIGIAADYSKRKYTIRVRAEMDQFLLSCVELSTFIEWLRVLSAAIDVAAPIDERDFPRDTSIPRVQRIRWVPPNSLTGTGTTDLPSSQAEEVSSSATSGPYVDLLGPTPLPPALASGDVLAVDASLSQRPNPMPTEQPVISQRDRGAGSWLETWQEDILATSADVPAERGPSRTAPQRIQRMSTTTYYNDDLDALSGKWAPPHPWRPEYDLIYAGLCFSILTYRSPRKSPYVIDKGRRWIVDWASGNMCCLQPPAYEELVSATSLHAAHTMQIGNSRI